MQDVVVGIIENARGQILLGRRSKKSKLAPGQWELPGGKIEPSETASKALVRELNEELGITVSCSLPWLIQKHLYSYIEIRLFIRRVRFWSGNIQSLVHDQLIWWDPSERAPEPLISSMCSIVQALRLPNVMGITCTKEFGEAHQLSLLEASLKRGLRFVQIRESLLEGTRKEAFYQAVLSHCQLNQALCVVNEPLSYQLPSGAHGWHLTAKRLSSLEQRPDTNLLIGASVHHQDDLEKARQLNLDYVLLSPVLPTQTHPGATNLGWKKFNAFVSHSGLPAYALGGLSESMLNIAFENSAHGIAGIRSIWQV